MRSLLAVSLVFGCTLGCGKKEETASDEKKAPPAALESVSSLLEKEPALFGPFSGVELGKTPLSEVAAAYREKKGGVYKNFSARFAAREDSMSYAWRKGKINEVEVIADDGVNLRSSLEKAWGEGIAAPDSSGRRVAGKTGSATYWFSPEKGLRARLVSDGQRATLNFALYQPFAALMGAAGNPLFGFEVEAPILGARREQLLTSYAGRINDEAGKIYVTKREYDFFDGQVLFTTKDDVVVEFMFVLQHEVAAEGTDARALTLKAFEKKFGPAKKIERDGITYLRFYEKPFIEIWEPAKSPWFNVRVAASDAPKLKGKDNQ